MIVCTLLALTLSAGGVHARLYRIDRDRVVRSSAAESESPRHLWHSQPSTRNLLGLERDRLTGFGRWTVGTSRKTLNILAIRVEFQPENPDDPNTTGVGLFDRRTAEAYHDSSGHDFDATPHGRTYVEAHMRALDLYWSTVSNNLIHLDYTVFPEDELAAYQVSSQMGVYGGQDPLPGLTQFVTDAANAARDADPALVFADYDAVFVVHAGSDRQSDLGFPATTSDLFTGYIRFPEPIRFAGDADSLVDAIIMPETTAQDGRINVLNAVMAHEFGHALGLVDLYKTRPPFLTQVGNFALMDNNVADVGVDIAVDGRRRILFGALPIYPCAWSRAYLGFVSINAITADGPGVVHAAERDGNNFQPQVVRIPISADEYYLIESRFVDLDPADSSGGLRADSTTNVILGPADTDTREFNREYDFLMPGSGMLIWHVDEGVARRDTLTDDDTPNNFLANTLQWNAERRFLTLVEADGIVDLGGYYAVGTGSQADYFYQGHNSRFGPFTNPPTVSRFGAYTGIQIDNIDPLSLAMTFDVTLDGALGGFPVWAGGPVVGRSPVIADGDGDGRPDIFVNSDTVISAWNIDGTSLFGATVPDTLTGFDGSDDIRQRAVVATGGGTFDFPPVVGIMDGSDFSIDMAAAARDSNVLYFWNLIDRGDGIVDPVQEWSLTGAPTTPVVSVPRDPEDPRSRLLLVGTRDGSVITANPATSLIDTLPSVGAPILVIAGPDTNNVFVMQEGGVNRWLWRYPERLNPRAAVPTATLIGIACGDLDRDGSLDAILVTSDGQLLAFDRELETLEGLPVSTGSDFQSPPTLADINDDGYLEILVASDGVVRAFNRFGVPITDYPVPVGPNNRLPEMIGRPIVANDSPRGGSAVTVGTDQELLHRFGARAESLGDSPRAVSGAVTGAPAAFTYVRNGESNLVAGIAVCDDDGYLTVLSGLPVDDDAPAWWPQVRHDVFATGTVPVSDLRPMTSQPGFLPEATTYVYPNPAATEARIRFWLGEDADVDIRIYDLAGNLVEAATTFGRGQTDNEWTWDCGDHVPGVYFCRVEASSTSGGTEHRICRMAIVR